MQPDPYSVPVLLIIWRRQDTLRQVIDAIRPVAPRSLYVASDGPRQDQPEEADQVVATRKILEKLIDWPCEVKRLYSTVNRGCRLGPIAAITWFFEHEDEGIILEDDCVPHPDFFTYCASLLSRYRHDHRVWCVSGNNFQNGRVRGESTYYFSRYVNCWGWATWRSRWALFDANLINWPSLRRSSLLRSHFSDPLERRYWTLIWDRTYQCSSTATWWDYQWQFALVINHALSITPNVNLVQNIGFGLGATHLASTDLSHMSLQTNGIVQLSHPAVVMPDLQADQFLFYSQYLGLGSLSLKLLLLRLWSSLQQAWDTFAQIRV